jgi:hypothetical protein
MPLAFVPPAGVNYGGSTLPRKATLPWSPPPEGPKTIPLTVSWVADGGPNLSINVNLVSTQVASISQIVGLYVDNIRNQAPVTFYFQDTQFVLEVPPLSFGWYPVITTALNFVMFCPSAVDTDQTIIQCLNYWIEPAAVSNFAFSDTPLGNVVIGNGLQIFPMVGPIMSTLIPAGTEGILTAFQIDAHNVCMTHQDLGFLGVVSLVNASSGLSVYWASGFLGNGYHDHLTIASLTSLSINFNDGIALRYDASHTVVTGLITLNLYWRQPS